MKLGVMIRNMGPASTRDVVTAAARAADATPAVSAVWVVDHIAIPPDDAEGSGGRYLDPLASLAYLAGVTTRVELGVAVLVLPYRPALPTAKWIATIQELSGGRLLLGVGVGWMEAEFRALGVDRRRRGRITDDTLTFLDACFADDVVQANGQPFLFKPRPARPPLFVGGAPALAFPRALAHRAAGSDGTHARRAARARRRPSPAGRGSRAPRSRDRGPDGATARRHGGSARPDRGLPRRRRHPADPRPALHGLDGFQRGLDAVAAAA